MKILYFHQHFTTPSGSSGTRSYEISKELISKGHSVTIVCGSFSVGETGLSNEFFKGIRSGYVDGIEIIELDLKYSSKFNFYQRSKSFLFFAIKSVKIALEREYDLIIASSTPLTISLPGIFARWIRKKPFIFEVRDLWPELPKAMNIITNPIFLFLLEVLEWISYKSAHLVITLSPGMTAGVKKRGIADSKIRMIPNGCDFDFFDSALPDNNIKGINKNDFLAIFSGSHGLANGLDSLIYVAEELKKQKIEDIKILLIGEGPEKINLINQSKRLGLENIIFLDPVSKHNLAMILKRANVGLQILANVPEFYYGTSPNKFFDYLSSGLPVITNYPGWIADIIKNDQCGFYAEPNDYKKFCFYLKKLSGDKKLCTDMSIRSKQLAQSKFLRKKLANEMIDNIEHIKLNHSINAK